MEVYKIVLTGGPCAGKTQIFNKVIEKLKNDGYYVIGVPETARECIINGIIPNIDKEHTLMFQDIILEYQKTKEANAERYADSIKNKDLKMIKDKKGIIILYDRAIIDNRAYLDLEDYENLLKRHNYNELELIDKYDLVIDLISLATAKKELYIADGERTESLEDAEHKDILTTNAWLLHHNLKVVIPTNNIIDKENKVLEYIYDLINNSQKKEAIRMPLDKNNTDLSIYNSDNSKLIKITNIFLKTNQEFNYVITKKQYKGNVSFVSKKEVNTNSETFIKDNKQISIEECLEKINMYGIEKIEEEHILSIIDKGNIYNVVEKPIGLFLETKENNILQIPDNLVVKNETKIKKLIFVKK